MMPENPDLPLLHYGLFRPGVAGDEPQLVQRIIWMASGYGRYGRTARPFLACMLARARALHGR